MTMYPAAKIPSFFLTNRRESCYNGGRNALSEIYERTLEQNRTPARAGAGGEGCAAATAGALP